MGSPSRSYPLAGMAVLVVAAFLWFFLRLGLWSVERRAYTETSSTGPLSRVRPAPKSISMYQDSRPPNRRLVLLVRGAADLGCPQSWDYSRSSVKAGPEAVGTRNPCRGHCNSCCACVLRLPNGICSRFRRCMALGYCHVGAFDQRNHHSGLELEGDTSLQGPRSPSGPLRAESPSQRLGPHIRECGPGEHWALHKEGVARMRPE